MGAVEARFFGRDDLFWDLVAMRGFTMYPTTLKTIILMERMGPLRFRIYRYRGEIQSLEYFEFIGAADNVLLTSVLRRRRI